MIKVLKRLAKPLLAAIPFMIISCANPNRTPAEHGIRNVTTIAESFGDGEKVSVVIVEYPVELDASSVGPECFAVQGRKVVYARTNSIAENTDASRHGRFVVLGLAYENKWEAAGANLFAGPRHDAEKDGGARKGRGNGPRFEDDGKPVDLSATVVQTADIRAADGAVIPASPSPRRSTSSKELVIQDFEKHYFTDSETGITLPYFVFLPKGYDKARKYPMVFFIPDASADTSIETATLTQGNGATIWATPEEQAKHPSIVVAVQYPFAVVKEFGAMTLDDHLWTKGLTAVHNLLLHLIETLAVDRNRVYGTGQSQGCMANIAISDRYPDLFAAQYLVAGQWDVAEMAAMKDKKLWILVCEGDSKAYPAMCEAMELWKSLGAKAVKGEAFWNPKATGGEMASNVRAMLEKDADIRMNVLAGGSHMYTWSIAYGIEGIRDWMFAQSRDAQRGED